MGFHSGGAGGEETKAMEHDSLLCAFVALGIALFALWTAMKDAMRLKRRREKSRGDPPACTDQMDR